MKLTDFFKMNAEKNEQQSDRSVSGTPELTGDSGTTETGEKGENFENNSQKDFENGGEIGAKETGEIGTNPPKTEPQSINELLNTLQNVGKQMQEPGNPDMSEVPNSQKEEKTTEPPTGKNVRDAKALVEVNDWGVSFGLSKYAKEPSENLSEAMEPYQASEDEKEDLTADLAELLQDSGIELPPGVKFAFTYLRIYGPKMFLAHINRKMYAKMEKEFERQKVQMREEITAMKEQFRAEMEREYKSKQPKNPVSSPKMQVIEKEELEANFEEDAGGEDTEAGQDHEFESTAIENDGSVIYEPKKVVQTYDQFRVKTEWEEPDTPAHLKNAPYAVALQGLIYEMIGELKRGEKIILDLLRDGFTQDLKPLAMVVEIPDKGTNGRKSTYERSLLEMILAIEKELRETQKKIAILKNTV